MRKPRKPPPALPVLRADLCALATRRMEESYEGYINDTAAEDPKRFAARIAAAREAVEHLRLLREIAADAAEAAPREEAELAEARAALAHENKT